MRRLLDLQTQERKIRKIAGTLSITEMKKIISSDIVGPFSTLDYKTALESDKFFVLTITDLCSRYTMIKALENVSSEYIKPLFER